MKMQQINTNYRELLARSISQFRRVIVREFVFYILRTFVDFDFSLPQLATLLLLDQLVERGMVSRREDEHDRRAKRVAITEKGRTLIATLEQRRADVQIEAMKYFSAEEQAEITRAMALLAEAGQRRRQHEHPESNPTEQ